MKRNRRKHTRIPLLAQHIAWFTFTDTRREIGDPQREQYGEILKPFMGLTRFIYPPSNNYVINLRKLL